MNAKLRWCEQGPTIILLLLTVALPMNSPMPMASEDASWWSIESCWGCERNGGGVDSDLIGPWIAV